MKKKIFITGAEGFVGKNLLKQLVKSNLHIIATSKKNKKIENVTFIKRRLSEVKVADLKNCYALFHFASFGAKKFYENKNFFTSFNKIFQTNVIDSINLINKAISAGIKKYIVAGSAFEYGSSGEKIKKLSINANLLPKGYYASSKACFYLYLKNLAKRQKIVINYLRFFQLYGTYEKLPRLYPTLIKSMKSKKKIVINNPNIIRDFINVDDAVIKTINLFRKMEKKHLKLKTFIVKNIGHGRGMTVKAFAKRISKNFYPNIKFNYNNFKNNEVSRLVAKL